MPPDRPEPSADGPERRPPDHRPAAEAIPPLLPGPCPEASSAEPIHSGPPGVPPPGFHGRLHPSTLLFTVWNVLRGFLIPLLILLALGQEMFLGLLFLLFGVLPLFLAVLRYVSFSYRLEGGDLVTRQGLFSRTERHIPLTRVQDVRIEQGILHRLLAMADVHVDTAGGHGAEAVLSVLSKGDADRLRSVVLGWKSAAGAGAGPEPRRELIRRVRLPELALAGITSNHLASALALLAVAWGLVDDLVSQERLDEWIQTFARSAGQWIAQAEATNWILAGLGAGLVLLVGAVVSVAGSIILFHGFTLSRCGGDLHRTYGLLTRRSSSLPRGRIQVLKIEEKLLRRLFRLATLRADTAGAPLAESNEARAGRDVLLPILPRREVEGILPEFLPDWNPDEGTWRPVSRKAIRRGTAKGSAACVMLAVLSYLFQRDWAALWPLAFIPAVYLLNLQSYRHLGYWHAETYFRTRRGWLSRAGHIVPIRNIQTVVIRQTPFDRRHQVGSILVDTAGQINTGGGPQIHNIHWNDACRLGWALARQTARTRYRW